MILSVTGHRDIIYNQTLYDLICDKSYEIISDLKPDKIITGMALGFDQLIADISIKLNIPFIAAVPFVGQENTWNNIQKERYFVLLSKAQQIIIVSPGSFSKEKFQTRNEWIVDHSDILLAYFTGKQSGTKNCIEYAKSVNKIIRYI